MDGEERAKMDEATQQKRQPAWLVCAATRMELEAFWGAGEMPPLTPPDFLAWDGDYACAVTGVGIPFTFGRLLPLVQWLRPQRILNIGIAGAFPNSGLKIGDIVMGRTEVYGDLGFELPPAGGRTERGFQALTSSVMGKQMDATAFDLLRAPEWLATSTDFGVHTDLVGATVNACTGTDYTGLIRESLFSAAFETMEGAAVAHIGFLLQIPVCEVRAISNIAARRDMRPENIRLALANLRQYLQKCRQ
jgi:futalosine hydrolase